MALGDSLKASDLQQDPEDGKKPKISRRPRTKTLLKSSLK